MREVLKRDPHCSHLFVFHGKARRILKILWPDGQGMCMLAKRFARGRFVWPGSEREMVTITGAHLGYLLIGIDWPPPQRSNWPRGRGATELGGRGDVASARNNALFDVTPPAAEPLPDDVETLKTMFFSQPGAFGFGGSAGEGGGDECPRQALLLIVPAAG